MKKYLDFSQEFGKVDEELIAEAGKPWTIKRGDIFRLYRRKIGQAAAILLAFITVAGNSHVQAAVKEFTTKIGIFQRFVCLYRSDKSGTDKEWDIINNQRSNFG